MKTEILYRALENLDHPAFSDVEFKPDVLSNGNLTLHFPFRPPFKMFVEVKKELRQHQLPQLIQRKQEHNNLLVVAERLHPKIKKHLQEEEIAYLEENGNIFIKADDLFLLIDTNKPLKTRTDTAKKAFTKTGVKLVFSFLLDPELINANQRTIAEKSGVSLGTVPNVIKILRDSGFLITHKKNFLWQQRKELLAQWIDDYEKILKPKLFRARFDLREDWQRLRLNQKETQWGGEPAGDVLTGYLRPEEFILYSNESTLDLMKNYNLKPNNKGELLVYEKFWNGDSRPTVPPLLVYADLILKEDKRCRETAQKIYDEYIQPIV